MWPRTAVIGAGFGDEGKGRVVDYLCSRSDSPLVVRFSGGHQAAHRVQLEDGRSHVFAHFGSGTFRGAPTYWSYHCPVNPMSMLVEFGVLRSKDVKPKLYIDRRCPITTPFEIEANVRRVEKRGSYDTCGVGIYETYKREKDGYHILMEDVDFPEVFEKKVRQLEGYYETSVPDGEINNFLWVMKNFFGPYGGGDPAFKECVSLVDDMTQIYARYESLIFEGSQGLLLDQTYGFFPHVTPSNTGTQNIREMGWKNFQVVLVTRAYQTRHGDGPMARESSVVIPDNPHEQNFNEGPQGKFRKAVLDLDMLRYAVMKDPYLRHHDPVLVITCMDLVRSDRWLIEGGAVVEYEEGAFFKRLREALHAKFILASDKPFGDMIGSANLTPGWQ